MNKVFAQVRHQLPCCSNQTNHLTPSDTRQLKSMHNFRISPVKRDITFSSILRWLFTTTRYRLDHNIAPKCSCFEFLAKLFRKLKHKCTHKKTSVHFDQCSFIVEVSEIVRFLVKSRAKWSLLTTPHFVDSEFISSYTVWKRYAHMHSL